MDKKRNENCPCTARCARHGDCEACQANHNRKGQLTTCQRIKKEQENG